MYRRGIFTLGGVAALAARGAAGPSTQSESGHFFSARSFGATGDGKTNDTAAIQKAIDECAQSGGGIVYVAPGAYLTGTQFSSGDYLFWYGNHQ
jgi:polygalacturonase